MHRLQELLRLVHHSYDNALAHRTSFYWSAA